MVARAWGVILLVTVSLAAVPAGQASAASPGCGAAIAQNDAGSGRDAGDTPDEAVHLPHEDRYEAAVSQPNGNVVDAEDWYTAAWTAPGERRVMVNVTGWAMGLSYVVGPELPAPHLSLEAYAPGAEEPTHTSQTRLDGTAKLNFTTTESGEWLFHVFVEGVSTPTDCTDPNPQATSPAETYNMYWGCEPHCAVTTT